MGEKDDSKPWRPPAAVQQTSPHRVAGYNDVWERDRKIQETGALRAAAATEQSAKATRARIAALSDTAKEAVWDAIDREDGKAHKDKTVVLIAKQLGITAMSLVRELPLAVAEL